MKHLKQLTVLLLMLCILATMLPTVTLAASESDLTAEGTCANCGDLPPVLLTNSEGVEIGGYTTLTEAVEAAVSGSTVTLHTDVVAENMILAAGVNLDLNGYILTVDSILTYSSSAIIDSSENATGVLKINDADGNMIAADNSQLPVYDHAAGGYRFFAMDVEPCAVTGKNADAPKVWFKIQAENFTQLYDLICADAEMQIKVKLTWEGQTEETYAVADLAFTKTWADRYNANEEVYVTVTLEEMKDIQNVTVLPCVGANGVVIRSTESVTIQNNQKNETELPDVYPYNVTYKEYLEMSDEEQVVFYRAFENHDEYKRWRNAAKKVYDDNKIKVEIGEDGSINLDGIVGGSNSTSA